MSFSRDLCERVLAIAEGLEPTSYHPSLKVGLTGKYRLILDQYESVNREIFTSAGVTLSLVALAIFPLLPHRRPGHQHHPGRGSSASSGRSA